MARGIRTGIAALALAAAAAASASDAPPARTPDGYRLAVPPYTFAFPHDHAAHPDFKTEWWYYTGHLEADGRRWGYELTFFRVGLDRSRLHARSRWALHTLYFAHFAITDEAGKRFAYFERAGRPSFGMSGADTSRYRVWVDDWRAELDADGTTHRLNARAGDAAIELVLRPLKPPAVHGAGGVSRKAAGHGQASHYYSLTRLETRGRLVRDGREHAVRGLSWMDHEFGSHQLDSTHVGWDWFSIQLDDGRDLMLYLMRREDGSIDPVSGGSWIAPDGAVRAVRREAFEVRATEHWTSPKTGGIYPARWTLRLDGTRLEVTPVLADQELVTGGGIIYWEGSVTVRGEERGVPLSGRGYVELTGYAGRVPGF